MGVVYDIEGKSVELRSLQYKSKEYQLEVMRNWFFENYEDPAESCPYESREGGYFYIYGGPYEADEVLQDMFGEYTNSKYIEELIDELQEECYEWSGKSNNIDDWYDEDLYEAVTSSEYPFAKFVENINCIKELTKNESNDKRKEYLLGVLYANVITVIETFYVELFVNSLEKEEKYFINCIENGNTEFKVSKRIAIMPFQGVTVEKIREELIKEIKEHLIGISWHSSKKVMRRYRATFGINVENRFLIDYMEEAIRIRNHLVHRSGKDKSGNLVVITIQDLEELLDNAMQLAEELYNSLNTVIDKIKQTNEEVLF